MGEQHGKLAEPKPIPTTDAAGNSPTATVVHKNIQADIWPPAPDPVLGPQLYDDVKHVLPRQVTIRKQTNGGNGPQLTEHFEANDFDAIKTALDMTREKMSQMFTERLAQKDTERTKTAPQR